MFGAAGAQVIIASATPLGTMSAQAVLSMIAPALPATPQGPSAAAVSEFQGLFAALLSADGATAPASDDVTASGEDLAETTGETAALPGFLSPLLPAPPVAAPVAGSAAPVDAEGAPTGAVPAPVPANPTAQADGAEPVQGSTPPVAAGAPDDLARPVTAVAATAGVVAEAAPAEDQTVPPEAARPAPVPGAAATPPPPAPPQLRPLAERVSKPLDKTDAGSTATAETAGGKAPNAAAAAAPAQTDQPIKPVPAAAAAITAPTSGDQGAPAEGPAAAESAPAQTEAAAPVREQQPSTLSRAAIDATVQIAAQIARKLEGRSTRFEIALRPDELGRVDVKLDIDSEGRLAARLAFDNPAAAADLRGRADELRRQLENAGFHLADDAFEFAERDSGSSAFDRGQDARQGQDRAFRTAARLNAEIDIAQPPQWLALSLSPSGVDMKV